MMLTARDAESDVILALEAGADDYLVKPVGVAEMRSRVRAALRRVGPRVDTGVLRAGALELDQGARVARVGATALGADAVGVRRARGAARRRRERALALAARPRDLRRRRVPRPARGRRPRPPPAREARGRRAAIRARSSRCAAPATGSVTDDALAAGPARTAHPRLAGREPRDAGGLDRDARPAARPPPRTRSPQRAARARPHRPLRDPRAARRRR